MSVVSLGIDPTYGLPVYQVEDQRYDLLGQWLTADLDRFFLVTLDALAMADDVARGEPPFEEWSSENYAVSFTPSALLITNLWVPGAEGEFTADVARAAVEGYWRFLVAQPERPAVGAPPPVPGAASSSAPRADVA